MQKYRRQGARALDTSLKDQAILSPVEFTTDKQLTERLMSLIIDCGRKHNLCVTGEFNRSCARAFVDNSDSTNIHIIIGGNGSFDTHCNSSMATEIINQMLVEYCSRLAPYFSRWEATCRPDRCSFNVFYIYPVTIGITSSVGSPASHRLTLPA